MDQNKLRLQVFEKTGIKIDVSDPVFALVALNESLLEETLRRHLAILQAQNPSTRQQATPHADNWESDEAHNHSHTNNSNNTSSNNDAHIAPVAPTAPAAFPLPAPSPDWLKAAATLAFAAALLAAMLVLAGQALFSGGNNAQTAQLQQAEQKIARFQKALEKLDPQVRSQVQSEINKP